MPFAAIDSPEVLALLIPFAALLIPIVAIATGNWRKAKQAEYRAITVQQMLDKGFTPDEIERVMRASDGGADKLCGRSDRRRDYTGHAR